MLGGDILIHNKKKEFDTSDELNTPQSYYKNIVVQIIIQAKKDYIEVLKNFDEDGVKSLEKFFYSRWFKFLFGYLNINMSPEEFFLRLKKIFLSYRRIYFMKKIFEDIKGKTRYYNLNEHEILAFGFSIINYYNDIIYKAIEKDQLTDQRAHEQAADAIVYFMQDYLLGLDNLGKQTSNPDKVDVE